MNFRKQISLFLAFFLLVSNLGLAFNVHYCDNEIASVSINSNSKEIEKDCCGKVERESKCCKNKIIKSVEKSDQITSKVVSFDFNCNLVFNKCNPLVFFNVKYLDKTDNSLVYYSEANPPPLYLLYSQYIFYA